MVNIKPLGKFDMPNDAWDSVLINYNLNIFYGNDKLYDRHARKNANAPIGG